jgi:P pilus assembly chaperone PapD
MNCFRAFVALSAAMASVLVPLSDAHAELVLSQLIIELTPAQDPRADVEVWNNGDERAFVAVDPREVTEAGKPSESTRIDPDPERLGLLVSPARMILEPGQHKLLRIAAIAPTERERVYRVTVKPVVGQLSSQNSGLKLLVGYDVLVLARPSQPKPHLSGVHSGNKLTVRNDGNVSVELVDGKECDALMKVCRALAGGRLYVGAEKTVDLAADKRAEFKIKIGTSVTKVQF